MTATLTLAQLRTQHEAAHATALDALAALDVRRPALALDDPAGLAALDDECGKLRVDADRHALALQELARREVAERQGQVERERRALAKQLDVTLAARMRHTGSAVVLAEQLGAAVGTIAEDERLAFEMARRRGVEDSLRSILPALADCLFARLQALQARGVPYVKHPDRVDELLATLLAMKPV